MYKGEEHTFLIEINMLLKRTCLFKCKISNYNLNHDKDNDGFKSYTMLEICDDDDEEKQKFKANLAFYQVFSLLNILMFN